MNCPICFTVMACYSEIHHRPYGDLMDLHCRNKDCEQFKIKYSTHMKVIARPNETWICDTYHLPFKENNIWYVLVGEHVGILSNSFTKAKIRYLSKHTSIFRLFDENKPLLMTIPFVPISTGNDMHEEAKKLFHRLLRLIPFS